jgi:peptidoglycan-N-acetylglucosamine deacetylase
MSLGVLEEVVAGGVLALGTVAAIRVLATKSDSQIYGRTIVAGRDPNELALTYDDGPNEQATMELLEVLHRHNARATFFMIGKFVRQCPHIVRAVQAQGHLIGNHTMNHPSLPAHPIKVVHEEIRSCSQALEDVLGAPVRYFRAPFGARRPAVLRCVRELGLVPVQWNAHGYDWDPIGADKMLEHIEGRSERARRKGRGVNLLLHDGSDRDMGGDRSDTIRVTDTLLGKAKQQGRRIVTVDAWG